MRSTIQRYLGASFIGPLIVSEIFFISFLLTFQLFRIMKLVVSKDIPIMYIFELVGHIAVSFLPLSTPLSILFATIYTLSKLSSDSEIMAMRALGYSKGKLAVPFLIIGFLIGSVLWTSNKELVPRSQRRFKEIISYLGAKGVLTGIKQGQFFTEIPQLTIFSEKVTNDGKNLSEVFIHTVSRDQGEEKVIMAKEGELIKEKKSKEFASADLRLKLIDGNITKSVKGKSELEKIIFQEYEFPLKEGGASADVGTRSSMRSTDELWELISKDNGKAPKSEETIKNELEFWTRVNTSVLCVIFSFLGLSLGIQRSRGPGRKTTTVCFFVLVIYYSLFFVGMSVAVKGDVVTWMACLFPSALALIVATKFYRDLEWLS